jgi:uncharacterized protein YjeT (DUF2065 family)
MNATTDSNIVHRPSTDTLGRLKLGCRLALGFVWVWEGLVPKILAPDRVQFEMVERSGLWWHSPAATLFWLGCSMIVAGLLITSGYRERLTVAAASAALVVLIFLVAFNEPRSITDPFGGLAKDACLFACAAVVWFLAPVKPGRPGGMMRRAG